MKRFAVLIVMALFGVLAGEARAQEAGIPLTVESVATAEATVARPTPMLVLTGNAAKATSDAKAATPDALKSPGTTAKQPAVKATAKIAPTGPPAPIVMSGAMNTETVEYGLVTTTGKPQYDEFVKQSAARNGVDPQLVIAVMRHESGFNLRATSYKGACGLMQLMPDTARRFGVTNIYDPAQNIEAGTKYLRFLLDTFNGDINLVLAGYNAGENAVVRSGFQVPRYRETMAYVKNISARYSAVKNQIVRTKTVAAGSAPPEATTFSSGRLSNNY
jgi:soluble lytic murein transglycosylase-like protein